MCVASRAWIWRPIQFAVGTAVVCLPIATFASAALPTTSPAPQIAWREAAGIAKMTIFEPKALFGLTLSQPYVSVSRFKGGRTSASSWSRAYSHGRSSLSITEASSGNCGNLGEVALVEKVRIGSSIASVWGCPRSLPDCRHAVPSEITWTARGTFIFMDWLSITLNHVIDLARSMTPVPRPPTIKPGKPNGPDETADASYVLSHNMECSGYPTCPLVFQEESDGRGGDLVAVDLLSSGPTCYTAFGTTYFFDDTTYLTSTASLAPRAGVARHRPVWAAGRGQFGVNFPVSYSSNVPCSEYGILGVDSYIYMWNGATMVVVYGQRPKAPQSLN